MLTWLDKKKKKKIKTIFHKFYSLSRFSSISFSQEGEDLILARIFSESKNAIYVDVCAHHPKRFSSTYYFYLQRWGGIKINPNPKSITLFKKYIPNDINLEITVFHENGVRAYYQYTNAILNSFSEDLVKSREWIEIQTIASKNEVKDQPLNKYTHHIYPY